MAVAAYAIGFAAARGNQISRPIAGTIGAVSGLLTGAVFGWGEDATFAVTSIVMMTAIGAGVFAVMGGSAREIQDWVRGRQR